MHLDTNMRKKIFRLLVLILLYITPLATLKIVLLFVRIIIAWIWVVISGQMYGPRDPHC